MTLWMVTGTTSFRVAFQGIKAGAAMSRRAMYFSRVAEQEKGIGSASAGMSERGVFVNANKGRYPQQTASPSSGE
ncbi:hypothetical protein V496_05131 [Pseudogymnoascus sp. VKM F-4515 (FW-2607)]|nr:hypothetical protein V496_05131 [Pseudogymnoascus sp. VKM F-4515 (FW-2607)]KFY94206.1 hypothetical protein V498_03994 [Pseudogymnoascus sp. VKM F-4517 (FW-2822)]